MKGAKVALAAAASGASAQYYAPAPASSSSATMMSSSMSMSAMPSSATTSYMTVFQETCIDEPATIVTVTNGYTVYYCSDCVQNNQQYTTIYETIFQAMCPVCEGYTSDVTYTVTESCPGTHSTPVFSRTMGISNYVPQGFTTTVSVCTECKEDFTATITLPCSNSAAPSVPPMAPATATAMPMPPASVTGSTEARVGYTETVSCTEKACQPTATGTVPMGMTETVSCTEAACQPTATGSAPMGMTETVSCTEASCQPAASTPAGSQPAGSPPMGTGSPSTPYSYGNTSGITPFTGSAASLSFGLWSGLVAIAGVAAGAFLL